MTGEQTGGGESAAFGPAEAAEWRAPLIAWYRAQRRDLPWRRNRDPYRVWISEAMLQQTRVEAVIPYYERFLRRFPSVRALAESREDEVVAAWSGLGYYRRARALRTAARVIVAEHAGRFPSERRAARALPGVGPYTAAAVLSIAYGLSEPLVDGNVARVFARAFALEDPLGSGGLRRRCEELAARLVPPAEGAGRADHDSPSDWNQALMELGATVCTPRTPRCTECPWESRCAARALGCELELPHAAPRRESIDVHLEIALAARGEEVLLVRRPAAGRMARLWELPTRELPDPAGRTHLWPSALPEAVGELVLLEELGRLSHAITHHRIRIGVLRAVATDPPPAGAEEPGWRWAGGEELEGLGLTGMTRKVIGRLFDAARDG